MKTKLLIISLALFFQFLKAQESSLSVSNGKFSLEVVYPFYFDSSNFLEEVVGIGGKYRFINNEKINYGLSLNLDYTRYKTYKAMYSASELTSQSYYYNNAIDAHLNGIVEFNIENLEKIKPFMGAGFTMLTTVGSNETTNSKGFNYVFGAQIYLLKSLFVITNFQNFVIYSKRENVKTSGHSNTLKLGLGFRL